MRNQMIRVDSLKMSLQNLCRSQCPVSDPTKSTLDPVKKVIFEDCIVALGRGGWTVAKSHAADDLQAAMVEEANRLERERMTRLYSHNSNAIQATQSPKTGYETQFEIRECEVDPVIRPEPVGIKL